MTWLKGWRAWVSLRRSTPTAWTKVAMVAVMLGMAVWGWNSLFPQRIRRVPQAQEAPAPPTSGVHPLTTDRDVSASETLKIQQRNASLEHQHKDDVNQLRTTAQEIGKLREENKAHRAAMDKLHAETLKALQAKATTSNQAHAQATQKSAEAAEIARLRALLAKGQESPKTTPPGSESKTFGRFEIKLNKEAMHYPMPPSPYRADTVYLMAGCYAPIQVVTGVPATARTDRSRQIMVSVQQAFKCPYAMQAPGLAPQETEIPIQGGYAFAAVQADLSAQRIMGEVQLLTLVMPSMAAFERPVKGYLVGDDGVSGIPGQLESHESRQLALASLYGAAKEIANIAALGKSQFAAVYSGGGAPVGTGAQSTFDQIGAYLLEQARALQPTLVVTPRTWGWLVITEGVPLDGYPTAALVTTRPAAGGAR